MLKLKIDGIDVEARPGTSILEAARQAGMTIPSLCYLKDVNCAAACRMCVVEIKGRAALAPACSTKAADGMEIQTSTPEIERIRKENLELICSHHRQDCSRCVRFPHCELHALCRQYEIDDRLNMFNRQGEEAERLVHLERDHSKCILCRRCVSMCRNVQGISAISVLGRGFSAKVSSVCGAETDCVNCGQCITACPTGALMEKNDTHLANVALSQRKKHLIAVVSDAAAAQLGVYFGGSLQDKSSKGKTAAALRRLGFRAVYDAGRSTVPLAREQCAALLERVASHGRPLISAACPSVKKYCQSKFPGLAEDLCPAESTMQAAAAVCADHYAQTNGVDRKEVCVMTISSCTADKYERSLPEYRDRIAAALTTHEVWLMFERACISSFSAVQVWGELPEESFDGCRSEALPAGLAFSELLPQLGAVCVESPRALPEDPAIVEAAYEYRDVRFKTAHVTSMKAVSRLLAGAAGGSSEYAWIEAFACPGGCVNGAGGSRRP